MVSVERLEENVLATCGRSLDDTTVAIHHLDAFELVRFLEGRELGEVDDALGCILDRAEVDLPAGQVRMAGVDLALPPFKT